METRRKSAASGCTTASVRLRSSGGIGEMWEGSTPSLFVTSGLLAAQA